MAHKPGHSGFSYWNGDEDKKPKKKRKRRRKVDVAKSVVKSDKESKERKSKAKTVKMFTDAEFQALEDKVSEAEKRVAKQRKDMWAPYGGTARLSGTTRQRKDLLPKSIDTKRQAYQQKQEERLDLLKKQLAAAKKSRKAKAGERVGGTTLKRAKRLAEDTIEGESQKQARTKKVVKAAKTQASMKAYAKKKKKK